MHFPIACRPSAPHRITGTRITRTIPRRESRTARAARRRASLTLALLALGLLVASTVQALPLYMGEVSGQLLTVDTTNGAITPEFTYGLPDPPGLVFNATYGLSARPGDPTHLYALAEYKRLDTDPAFIGGLVELDLESGSALALAPFDATDVGLSFEISGIALAVDPMNPGVAIVAGAENDINTFFFEEYIWQVDLATGAAIGTAVSVDYLFGALTYSLDGSTLYAAAGVGVYVLDPETGESTLAFTAGTSVTGLAFAPDGTLYALSGTDDLVILDPVLGGVAEVVGPTGFAGPKGLAFVPEPSVAWMLAAALLALRTRHRARG